MLSKHQAWNVENGTNPANIILETEEEIICQKQLKKVEKAVVQSFINPP